MIAGIVKLLPLLNKAISLVPDKNKMAAQKAAMEKELLTALVDLDKEQAKIIREDAKATGPMSWMQRLWRPTLAWVCVVAFMFQFLVVPITNWYCALIGKEIILPTLDASTLTSVLFALLGMGAYRSFDKMKKIDTRK